MNPDNDSKHCSIKSGNPERYFHVLDCHFVIYRGLI